MNLKNLLIRLSALLSFQALAGCTDASTAYTPIIQDQRVIADVVHISDLDQLKLVLNNAQGMPYKKFSSFQKDHTKCAISFAMNAGMYHANFAPVGLYIEQSKQKIALNTEVNQFGNFFIQPNGVVAWNKSKAMIVETKYYAQANFKADYATQSGPMLVINGEINPKFEATSTSLKIRNGVGIKDNQLYFVISRGKISFYDFANIFKKNLKIDQALYLDGSISSAYIPQAKRHDQIYELGPMFIYDEKENCKH